MFVSYFRTRVIFLVCLFSLGVVIYYLHLIDGFASVSVKWQRPKYHFKPEFTILNGPSILANDVLLLSKLSRNYIEKGQNVYNLENVSLEYEPSMGQSQIVRKIFENNNKDKFFIECGALDGETRSNTLYLERILGWEGLLIEADPVNYQALKIKGRKSWSSQSCLSTKVFPTMVSFEQRMNQGKISDSFTAGYLEKGYTDVQCFPFATYMYFLNRTVVDYFSLDVEGFELEILKTIDFNKFDVKVLSVEFIHDKEGKDAIELYMKGKGYFVLGLVTHPNWLANDFIFVKESLVLNNLGNTETIQQFRERIIN